MHSTSSSLHSIEIRIKQEERKLEDIVIIEPLLKSKEFVLLQKMYTVDYAHKLADSIVNNNQCSQMNRDEQIEALKGISVLPKFIKSLSSIKTIEKAIEDLTNLKNNIRGDR